MEDPVEEKRHGFSMMEHLYLTNIEFFCRHDINKLWRDRELSHCFMVEKNNSLFWREWRLFLTELYTFETFMVILYLCDF